MSSDIQSIKKTLKRMTAAEIAEIDKLISGEIWMPLPGPQMAAYYCEADELFYGGAAGGGKTDLALGLGLTAHTKTIIFRREATQLQGILDRLHNELLKSRDGYNGQEKIQRLGKGKQIEFGSCPNLGDEQKYQGRPHDLIVFDEITHFLPQQYKFLCGWLRTTQKNTRCRIVCTGNPPTSSDGEWVIKHWGPWLDELHPNPAEPGELRWYAIIDGEEQEVVSGTPFEHRGETIQPKSRTFIPSRVQDNIFLMETGYMSQLQALPEPLRSQMLEGDFRAGMGDDPWQTLPTGWVKAAQDRWEKDGHMGLPMESVGVDPARGGDDKTVISRRHGGWFDNLISIPGKSTPDGPSVVALAVIYMRDAAPAHVDVIGIGSSVYDHMMDIGIQAIPINGADKAEKMDSTGVLKFRNKRAELYWTFREMLDPKRGDKIQLPPDAELRADLCAPRWKMTPSGIQIESKEDLSKRIGRSPDKGDAVIYASVMTIKRDAVTRIDLQPDYEEVY